VGPRYERRTGLILCTERMFNWEKRNANRQAKEIARRDNPRAKGAYVRGKDVPRADRDWWKAHEHLRDDQIRSERQARQQSEAAKFNEKVARHILLTDAKIARTTGKQRAAVLEQLHNLKAEARQPPARRPGFRAAVLELFRKTANAITRSPVRRRGTIERLRESAHALGIKIEDQKKSVREDVARAWTRVERRHATERQRDEERIAHRQREARGRQTGERALKQFNLRGHGETARHVQPATRPLTLTHAYVAATSPDRPAQKGSESLLNRLARRIGWKRGPSPSLQTPASSSAPQPLTPSPGPKPPDPVPAFQAAASDQRTSKPPAEARREDYERRVDKALTRLEHAERQDRQRRHRKRPRARGRRMSQL
jgi:hypothetical protein